MSARLMRHLAHVAENLPLTIMPGAPHTGPWSAEQELVKLAKGSSGEMGVAAIHIESGRRITMKSSERFPMASTYKLPIAIHLLMLVDEGKEQLERMIKIEPRDIRPGGVPLTDEFN